MERNRQSAVLLKILDVYSYKNLAKVSDLGQLVDTVPFDEVLHTKGS